LEEKEMNIDNVAIFLYLMGIAVGALLGIELQLSEYQYILFMLGLIGLFGSLHLHLASIRGRQKWN